MTKSTITREESVQAVFDLKVGYRLGFADLEILKRVARMALAAMDSEPVAYISKSDFNAGYPHILARRDFNKACTMPVYAEQPAPVVPDEIKHRIGGLDWGWEGEFNRGWNACRSAMLAAAPQSPGGDHATAPGKWIPVSEQLPEDSGRYWCYVEEQNDLGKSHYQWNCSWNGDRWWVESEGGGIVTHWMPLPAAPQEVK
ncbi:TPA: DUF551 domain-containing protein [Klebsiella pneumoniae]